MGKISGIIFWLVLILLFSTYNANCQVKAPVRIYLEHFRSAEKRQISVRVLAKKDKRYRPASGVSIELFWLEIDDSKKLATIITADDGTAEYILSQKQIEFANSFKSNKFFAVVHENDSLQSKQIDIIIRNVDFEVQFMVEDSVKLVQIRVSEKDSMGLSIPQEDVEISLLVERPLSALPVGEDFNTTDEDGKVTLEFPSDLPGDIEGAVTVIVRIVENENYGTVEISQVKTWGIPTHYSDLTTKRSLWASSANAPIPLIIFITGLIIAVWGMIFYMIYKIYQIKKLGKVS